MFLPLFDTDALVPNVMKSFGSGRLLVAAGAAGGGVDVVTDVVDPLVVSGSMRIHVPFTHMPPPSFTNGFGPAHGV